MALECQRDTGAGPFAVMVTLPGVCRNSAADVLASANEVLATPGVWLSGPHPLGAEVLLAGDTGGPTLIHALAERRPARRVVALVPAPLLGDQGQEIVGEAQVGGRIAVVSVDAAHANADRVARNLLHEAGHLRGLKHCGAARCLMNPRTVGRPGADWPAAYCPKCLGLWAHMGSAKPPSADGALETTAP